MQSAWWCWLGNGLPFMDKLNVLHYTSGVARNVELAGHGQIRTLHCRRQCAEIFFAFIFQLSGWALVAPSCFALRVPDV